jgi:hypothetical protein
LLQNSLFMLVKMHSMDLMVKLEQWTLISELDHSERVMISLMLKISLDLVLHLCKVRLNHLMHQRKEIKIY